MPAYRDESLADLADLVQHVAIAETLLDTSWWDAWAQLDQARAILVRHGRGTGAFDAARARAEAAAVVGAGVTPPMRAATRDAIAALRAAVPEVVVPGAPVPPDAFADGWTAAQQSIDRRESRNRWFLALLFVLVSLWRAGCALDSWRARTQLRGSGADTQRYGR